MEDRDDQVHVHPDEIHVVCCPLLAVTGTRVKFEASTDSLQDSYANLVWMRDLVVSWRLVQPEPLRLVQLVQPVFGWGVSFSLRFD